MSTTNKDLSSAGLFGPRVVNRIVSNYDKVVDQTLASISSSDIANSGSFKFDPPWPGAGLKSTQQLPIDFTKFENHTFFNSAEVKVNVAFDKLINEFPFDGNFSEYAGFFDNLTGFEKYVFDEAPKSKNYLRFAGETDDTGTYLKVIDSAGHLNPRLSRDKTGYHVLDPGLRSISFEMQLFVPTEPNSHQIIFQKLSSNNQGITIALSGGAESSPGHCPLIMIVSSRSNGGTHEVLTSSMKVQKGGFRHVCCELNRDTNHHKINLYQSGTLITSSSVGYFGDFNFGSSMLTIGSGSSHITSSAGDIFHATCSFSGAIDELRVFHATRSPNLQKEYQFKNVFATDNLKLYFKFNEPSGSYSSNNVALDSSGNSLHTEISNFDETLKATGSLGIPLKNELDKFNPVLFPSFTDMIEFNASLMVSASHYDASNPNLITRMIPAHYLSQESFSQGFVNESADVGQLIVTGSEAFPGGATLNSGQIIATLLFLWAKFFDEIKMFVDSFSDLHHVDYTNYTNNPPYQVGIPNQLLPSVGASKGFLLPTIFNNANIFQFLEGQDVNPNLEYSQHSLKAIQDEIWRRILVNYNDIIRSKGTIHGVKALFRAAGMNPDKLFRFREFGGAISEDVLSKDAPRINTTEISTMFDMSGGLSSVSDPADVNTIGFHTGKPYFISPFLSGARYEVGFPVPRGTMVDVDDLRRTNVSYHGTSNNASDGLFTSGSWTYEAFYQFNRPSGSLKHFATQSLVRLESSGSSYAMPWLSFNLLAFSASNKIVDSGSLRLYGRPLANSPADPLLKLTLTGVNIFDGDKWHVSFGRVRGDEINVEHSSSYFLRAAKPSNGELAALTITSSLFATGAETANGPVQNTVSSNYNTFGYFAVIGSQSFSDGYNIFMNSIPTAIAPKEDIRLQTRMSEFSGKFGHIRFWSKALTTTETIEHARNFKSLGVEDPLANFNFVTMPTGSFGKLRLDVSTDQPVTRSDSSGNIKLTDFSQQFSGIPDRRGLSPPRPGVGGLETEKEVIKPVHFKYSFINPRFDERSATNKIRIRSWEGFDNVELLGGETAPVYEVRRSEVPVDDTRFSIEASVVQALDEDIINIFATLEKFNDYIGRPELLFSQNYPDLRNVRDVYFRRLDEKINIRLFFEVFRWLDDSFEEMVAKLLPSKTKFLGINFVVESHVLERSKFSYDYVGANLPVNLQLASIYNNAYNASETLEIEIKQS